MLTGCKQACIKHQPTHAYQQIALRVVPVNKVCVEKTTINFTLKCCCKLKHCNCCWTATIKNLRKKLLLNDVL